ncbi:MFS transporter [Actinocatenispora thailandica]|uniref:MFS transporter n=1 Tax=Actinocatenispora thailandica TaxID=227318 RepID=A0A7R7DP47_9ACTN|nr:MFS transporter [Actinocatenispora thailandica]BCJ35101.1 MFS transporter [Actinocatenispora thailandica]
MFSAPPHAPLKATVRARVAGLAPADPVTRRLAVQTLINTLGNGLFMTVSAVFFTRSVGLSAVQVGLGLTIAGACGVAAGIPLGQLADRIGAKRLLIVLYLAQAVGLGCYALVGSFPAFLVVACVVTALDSGGRSVKNAMLATALPAQSRVRSRAYLRAVTNVGIGAGSALAAVALSIDTRSGYLTLIAVDAATFLATTLLLRGIPAGTPVPRSPGAPGGRRLGALRDPAFLAVTALNGVLAIQFSLIDVTVPLWVVGHTHAPAAVVSGIMITNTALVVLFQVRATRNIADPGPAARVARRAGLLLAAACAVFGLAHGVGPIPAVLILLAATVLQAVAEMLSSAAGWALSYELADPAAPGAYQGLYNTGFAAASMLAPALTTNTAIRFGLGGWLALGVLFAAAGAALVPVTRWALATRPSTTEEEEQA